MDEAEREPKPTQLGSDYPNWLSAIEDQQARAGAERLYVENAELQRRQESNLKFITSLDSKCTVQQERIDRLERKRVVAVAAIGGGLTVVGLAALLIANYPTLGLLTTAFLLVLLGRACFPALLDLMKAWARSHAPDRF